MAEKLMMQLKKSAQDGTTVTLVPDTQESGDGALPLHKGPTQIVITFTATPSEMFGTATTDGRRFRVIVEQYT